MKRVSRLGYKDLWEDKKVFDMHERVYQDLGLLRPE